MNQYHKPAYEAPAAALIPLRCERALMNQSEEPNLYILGGAGFYWDYDININDNY